VLLVALVVELCLALFDMHPPCHIRSFGRGQATMRSYSCAHLAHIPPGLASSSLEPRHSLHDSVRLTPGTVDSQLFRPCSPNHQFNRNGVALLSSLGSTRDICVITSLLRSQTDTSERQSDRAVAGPGESSDFELG
jgi:hypothetical protein